MRWMHSRKGLIEGEIVKDGQDFVVIKLDDPELANELSSYGNSDGTITVRKSFLKELTDAESSNRVRS